MAARLFLTTKQWLICNANAAQPSSHKASFLFCEGHSLSNCVKAQCLSLLMQYRALSGKICPQAVLSPSRGRMYAPFFFEIQTDQKSKNENEICRNIYNVWTLRYVHPHLKLLLSSFVTSKNRGPFVSLFWEISDEEIHEKRREKQEGRWRSRPPLKSRAEDWRQNTPRRCRLVFANVPIMSQTLVAFISSRLQQFFPAHMVADPSETADNLFEKPKRPRPPLLLVSTSWGWKERESVFRYVNT